jgi:tetratricopeptide (TPR) repeat protein
MAFFDKLFGKGRQVAAARSAELRGDLAKAAELFGEAGLPDDAARVILLRGEGETDARARLQFYAQAARLAPDGTPTQKEARTKRAELLLALAGDAAISAVAKHEVIEAARDLEAVGEPLRAAEAYARAGDKESEARALQAAGDVERLEFLLSMEQNKERVSRARDDRAKDVDMLLASGRRREALAALEELLAATPDDAPLRERANGVRTRKVTAPVVVLEVTGERVVVVLGDEVVIGRTDGAIKVSSNAVSRQHLRIGREGGDVVVRDLESRNGTQLRGINLAGALAVKDGLDLKLGKEVPLRLAPSKRIEGAIEIDVAGEKYVACLGPARLPLPGLELAAGADGWVELISKGGSHAYLGEVELVGRATLLVGDALATSRGGEPVIRLHGS